MGALLKFVPEFSDFKVYFITESETYNYTI